MEMNAGHEMHNSQREVITKISQLLSFSLKIYPHAEKRVHRLKNDCIRKHTRPPLSLLLTSAGEIVGGPLVPNDKCSLRPLITPPASVGGRRREVLRGCCAYPTNSEGNNRQPMNWFLCEGSPSCLISNKH